MLDIKLIGIVLVISKEIDHFENAVKIGNAAARCIVIKSAVGHIGLVFNFTAFDILAAGFEHLAKRLDTVKRACEGIAYDVNAVFTRRYLISLSALFAKTFDNYLTVGIGGAQHLGDNGIDARLLIYFTCELLRRLEDTAVAFNGQDDIKTCGRDEAARFLKLFRLRNYCHCNFSLIQ